MDALGLEQLPVYTARVVPNTQLVEISVIDTVPQRAQAVANELVTQLDKLSPTGPGRQNDTRQRFIEEQLTTLETKIRETEDEITKAQNELVNMFSARQIADAQTAISALQTKQLTLQANYAALLNSTAHGVDQHHQRHRAGGLADLGLSAQTGWCTSLAVAIRSLAVRAAYLLEYLDDTLKNPMMCGLNRG
jgi:septal ring factor EnvC (AmiA/AmiB activator)